MTETSTETPGGVIVRRRRWAIVVASSLLLVLSVSVFFWLKPRPTMPGIIEANGEVEGDELVISSQVAGRIVEVPVSDGRRVEHGQILVRLDSDEAQARLDQATAHVAHAEAQLVEARAAAARLAHQEEEAHILLRQSREWTAGDLQRAKAGVDVARAQVTRATAALTHQRSYYRAQLRYAQAGLELAKAKLAEAAAESELARRNRERYEELVKRGAVSQQQADVARTAHETAQAMLRAAEKESARANAALAMAQAGIEEVRLREAEVKTEQGRRAEAESILQQARAGSLTPVAEERSLEAIREHMRQARAAVASASARVVAAEATRQEAVARLGYAEIRSPGPGTITEVLVESGETVAAGTALLTMIDLSRLRVTAYLPLVEAHRVKVGDLARIYVDSFPGRFFEASVSRIAEEAEFTPRPVHMKDERVRLVYAVELAVRDPEGDLKPGMPADAEIRWQSTTPWERCVKPALSRPTVSPSATASSLPWRASI
ncbi:MAG: HlyD family efflux transporter periplasmic adaptor subunit [Armatimonadetes bacterium]|nr:HlyD family efflux transporter periplasmic adaptor subunit [Armatimonadota bacterium]